jgi:hypothetical protein
MVTLADADLVLSATLVAVTVTVPEDGTAGAVKSPLAEMVPRDEFPPTTPSTLQMTDVSSMIHLPGLVTEAEKARV